MEQNHCAYKPIIENHIYTNNEKKIIFDKINTLSTTEHEEIYRIICDHSVNVSKNKNGVFFNLSSVENDVVAKIDAFVSYCVSNKVQLDEYDKRLNECKMSNKYGKIENMNIRLENLPSSDTVTNEKDDWNKVKLENKSVAKLTHLIDRMQEDREKLNVKRVNSKFVNAKKRFSKKVVSDKKFDYEHITELEVQPYVL